MLPCNVIAQDLGGGRVVVAAINPLAAMEKAPALASIAKELASKLERVVTSLGRG